MLGLPQVALPVLRVHQRPAFVSAGRWKLETPSSSIYHTQFPQGDAEEIQKVKLKTLTVKLETSSAMTLATHMCPSMAAPSRRHTIAGYLSAGEAGLPSPC